MTITQTPTMGPLDKQVAGEIRARCARMGISQKELAARIDRPELWVSRRLSPIGGRHVTMNLDELELFAKALGTSWMNLLPHLDSNQEPAG